MGALWLPYRRDRTELELALAAATGAPSGSSGAAVPAGGAQLQAVFAHTDIVRRLCCCKGLALRAARLPLAAPRPAHASLPRALPWPAADRGPDE